MERVEVNLLIFSRSFQAFKSLLSVYDWVKHRYCHIYWALNDTLVHGTCKRSFQNKGNMHEKNPLQSVLNVLLNFEKLQVDVELPYVWK